MNVNWKKMCYAQKQLFKLQNSRNDMRRETDCLLIVCILTNVLPSKDKCVYASIDNLVTLKVTLCRICLRSKLLVGTARILTTAIYDP